jgi:hypothetical protein
MSRTLGASMPARVSRYTSVGGVVVVVDGGAVAVVVVVSLSAALGVVLSPLPQAASSAATAPIAATRGEIT